MTLGITKAVPTVIVLMFSVLGVVGCNGGKTADTTQPTAAPTAASPVPQAAKATTDTTTTQPTAVAGGPSTALPQTSAQPEQYHSVDPGKAGLSFDLEAGQMEWDAEGWITGDISTFNVVDAHGRSMPIKLLSKSVSGGQIKTKDFGIIKARSVGGFSLGYLMKDSQLKEIQRQLQEQGSKAHP